MLSSYLSPKVLDIYMEEEEERLSESVMMDDYKKIVFSKYNRTFAHMNSQQLS